MSQTDGNGFLTTYEYDNANRLTRLIDADLRTTRYGYTAGGRLNAVTDGVGNTTTYTHDSAGRVATEVAPKGRAPGADPAQFTTRYGYDFNGNLTTVSHPFPDGGTATVTYQYNSLNELVAAVDPLGHSLRYGYDAAGNVASVTDPLGLTTTATYDGNNRRTSVTDPRGKTTRFTYDAAGNLTAWTTPGGQKTTYRYDAADRLIATTSPRGNVEGADSAAFTSRASYDPAGQVISATDALGNVSRMEYDPARRLSRLVDPNGQAIRYTYDNANRLTRILGPDATNDTQATVNNYDHVGHLIDRTDPRGFVQRRTYDAAGRLASTIDGIGNRREYTYDANGNLVTGPDRRITWDENNRPVDVEGHHYEYDGNGARVAKHALVGGLTLTSYYVNPHIERDPGGELVSYYYAGPVLVARRDAAGILHYHVDAQGSVRVLTDHRGLEVGKYRYTGFGVPSFTGSTLLRNERKFTSQVHDEETGLMHLGARSYDPALGRFLSADPVIPDPYVPQSLNHYTYALNDPVNLSDQTGFAPKPAEFSPPTQWGDNYVVAENELVYGPGFTRDEFGRMTYSGPLDDNGMPPAPITLAEFVRLRTPDVFRSIGDERVRYSGKDFFENNWPNTTIDEANAAAYRAYDYTRCSFESEWPTIILQAQAMRSAAKAMIPRARPGASGAIIAEVVQETEKRVTVTSWAAKGITPDLSPGRWVQLGEATKWNFFKTGLLGPKAYTKEAFPFIRFEWSKVPLSNSITGEVPVFKVQWPPGWEAWKGILGQRVLAP